MTEQSEALRLAEPGSLMIAAQQFLEWNRSQTPPRVEVGFELGVFEAAMKTCTAPSQRPAEPVQEPVAKYSDIVSDGGFDPRNKYDTAPHQRKPLTDDGMLDLISAAGGNSLRIPLASAINLIRAVEAAHNIK